MALLLALETATPVCSVALARNGEILVLRESTATNVHSARLTIFIEEILAEAGLSLAAIDAVAVSMGPGSYTGLRIGVATAKGLCYGLDIPLVAVPTLKAMAEGMRAWGYEGMGAAGQEGMRAGGQEGMEVGGHDGRRELSEREEDDILPVSRIQHLVCPMIDARRMEVYCAVYSETMEEILPVDARIITEQSFAALLERFIIIFGGDGAAKCLPALGSHPNARFLTGFRPSARFMIPLAETRFAAGLFETLAYFEPFYLKDFVAGKPRVKGL